MEPGRTLGNCMQALVSALALSVALHGQTLNTLYTFGNGFGDNPVGAVAVGPAGGIYGATSLGGGSGLGALYGTTLAGGIKSGGTVYQLAPNAGGGAWTEQIIYSFPGYSGDGEDPTG